MYDDYRMNHPKMAGAVLGGGLANASYNRTFDRKRIEMQLDYARLGVRNAEIDLEEHDDTTGPKSMPGDWSEIRRERLQLAIDNAKNEVRRIEIDLKEFDHRSRAIGQKMAANAVEVREDAAVEWQAGAAQN